MYLVEYFIKNERFTAGPYGLAEIDYQFADIVGYEGIKNASIIPYVEIKFYKSNDPNGFLGNFKRSRMFIYDRWWNNVESPYQSKKCIWPEGVSYIWEATTPKEARDRGQEVEMRSDWDDIKNNVMHECVLAKFIQNQDFLNQLLDTGKATLIEDSPVDSYWGCGKDGKGKNQLGLTLMKVREELKGF